MVTPTAILGAIVDGLLVGSIYGIISMGLALIWGVIEIINFAHGDFITLAAYLAYTMWFALDLDPLKALPLIFAIIFAFGYLIEKGPIKRILGAPPLNQIFVTFALALVMRYSLMVIFGPFVKMISGVKYAETVLRYGFISIRLPQLVGAIASATIVLLLYLFLTRTYVGTAIRAVAQNTQAAYLMGVNVHRIYAITFALGVAIAGVGGVILSLYFPIYAEMGLFFGIMAFVAVVLGGFTSIFGAYIAGLILGITETLSALFIPPTLKTFVAFLIFVIILLVKPTGLFGRR